MNSAVAKQYLLIKEKPVIYYSLREFESCPFIDEIVLVAGADDLDYCREEIIRKYDFRKVKRIIAGGKERYHSVYNGLMAAEDCDYIYIHDGARPFVTQEILERAKEDVQLHKACVVGMPVKDTIKIGDEDGFCANTPERSRVWQIQTPQVFEYSLILGAYGRLMEQLKSDADLKITDDAMVVETMTDKKVKLTTGSYSNIKITTPDDLRLAELLAE